MKIISSRQNPEIVSHSKLATAKERTKQQKFIAEGVRTCSTLMASGIKLVRLYVLEELYSEYEVQSRAQQAVSTLLRTVPQHLVTLVEKPVLEKLSQTQSSSGVVGIFHIPKNPTKPATDGLVLAHINDPGNMGTLIRTAAALKIPSIIVIQGADIWSPKVIQSCAGTLGLSTLYTMTWQEFLAIKGETPLCALVVKGGKSPRTLRDKKHFIMVGNEAHGIPTPWLEACDDLITIPMEASVESLNAAVAGSLALYLARSSSCD
jgi:TrmH family RNA methyltransferase